ncbi:hypothetical protein [Enhygromyxa salina]|uniref:hypothetical protein n=1 Tax=Enhygromyxa salina TaxID=215803 RepID=UPI0011B26E26|nr:hypothetical protein [Enhygromyxa salina]
MTRLAFTIAALTATGCQVSGSQAPERLAAPTHARAPASSDVRLTRELVGRYGLALTAFDRGEYQLAADMFTQLLLALPPDPREDHLRHLLVQHIGWSLLGHYDVDADVAALDRGEQTLERYLVRHEALLPTAHAEREVIYALLGEYQLRRDGKPPPDANARLVALVEATQTGFERQSARSGQAADDALVRVIEVEAIPWAHLDDPRVQAFLRDPRALGPTLFDKPGQPLNPTRVLVRGRVHPTDAGTGKRAHALLKLARPAAERCYEGALSRGAGIVERVRLDLTWAPSGLPEVNFGGDHQLDAAAQTCVREAVREADGAAEGRPAPGHVELRLTFFVQFETAGPDKYALDTDSFGLTSPNTNGVPWLEL